MTPITTGRCIIDKLSPEDTPFFLRLINSEGWKTFIGDRQITTEKDALGFLQRAFLSVYDAHGFGYYKISNQQQVPMGICGFLKKPDLPYPDFGFAILPEFEGQGFAFEASSQVIDYCCQKFNLTRFLAVTLPSNVASIALLTKLGFQYLETVTDGNGQTLKHYELVKA